MLNKVTFTGIDNKTDINSIVDLYKHYPFIEFGFLISENATNKRTDNKYPDLVILKKLKNKNIPLSLHVCGKLAREIIKNNNWQPLIDLMGNYLLLFDRIQLNVAGTKTFSKDITFPLNQKIIIQTRSDETSIYEHYKNEDKVVGFQDNSGGTGKTENTWMNVNDEYFGYAGGIGEDNVIEVVKTLNTICKNSYWIDMETKIRNDKNWFDVKKCEKICLLLKSNNLVEI